jgi:hypothetical protein
LCTGDAYIPSNTNASYLWDSTLAGATVKTLVTGSFFPEQICEAPDGTIWSLGKANIPNDGQQHDTNVVRHYQFDKGQLHSFLPESTVQAPVRSKTPWFMPYGSYVRCGKENISVYLNFTREYVEINASSLELKRWKLDESVLRDRDADGFAVTDDERT